MDIRIITPAYIQYRLLDIGMVELMQVLINKGIGAEILVLRPTSYL